jgi:hypothetical protein
MVFDDLKSNTCTSCNGTGIDIVSAEKHGHGLMSVAEADKIRYSI